jgi:hypothetical protein
MHDIVISFLNPTTTFTDEQYGFRETYIFRGLAKAFSCMNHDTLLPKQSFYGTQSKAGQWFKFYLHGT